MTRNIIFVLYQIILGSFIPEDGVNKECSMSGNDEKWILTQKARRK
jgi:hypothetical protein